MADDTSILASRDQMVSDLYREAASMLAGMGKKRKLGSKELEEEEADGGANPLSKWIDASADPLETAFSEQDQAGADQEAALGSDPVIGSISKIKPPPSGSGANWKRKIYGASRAASQKQAFSATGNDVNAVATALWKQAQGAAGK